jgi:hypothetical protein
MRIKKTVTTRKRRANQTNSKRSTGPRTTWGKSHSRFNAVKQGLFAAEVVIPYCDGDEPVRNFSILLDQLIKDLHPNGKFETVLVEKIAEALWGLRRATRAESGAVMIGIWDGPVVPPKGSCLDMLIRGVDWERRCLEDLTQARGEIQRTGTLPKKTYDWMDVLFRDRSNDQAPKRPDKPENVRVGEETDTAADEAEEVEPGTTSPGEDTKVTAAAETKADVHSNETGHRVVDDDFVRRLEAAIESLRYVIQLVEARVKERSGDLIKRSSIPPAEDMEKISRVRARKERSIDWALRTLFQLQKRNRKRRLADGHQPQIVTGKNSSPFA